MTFSKTCRLSLVIVPGLLITSSVAQAEEPQNFLDEINNELVAMDAEYRAVKAEFITVGEDMQSGRTILASDRGNKQFNHDFVPGDARRGNRTDIGWIIDNSTYDVDAGALTLGQVRPAMESAMRTWQSVSCSDIPLTRVFSGYTLGYDIGAAQYWLGAVYGISFGGHPYPPPLFFPGADVVHAGFLPADFFDLIAPSGGDFMLGVTFTFAFPGLTDIDDNGKIDVWWRETYYNENHNWGIDVDYPGIDVRSIVLHEWGHLLSQGHFGEVVVDAANGKVHYAPRAVMNNVYSGQQQKLAGTDKAGHCSNWANWPEN